MTDIVERLRWWAGRGEDHFNRDLLGKAADEIERLRALRTQDELRHEDRIRQENLVTLEEAAKVAEKYEEVDYDGNTCGLSAAIRALKEKP